ncbi:SDR family NAD(P)-dependent oxidoreductase [Nitrospirillum viridazoti]|uniref:3-oxoacyl-[acyl-carrier protein] reductase n=1 Tax=Nitrospirillum amazonense TaxID=28077 RepID=A0A560I1V7_9PROT|nr:glucose 1-dehydrogenase [Nitrospirillum amazonense]TWB52913.1 3-oxoacyl-[acyl-carrier protein] reductase [Nitrospirillum amazonense]
MTKALEGRTALVTGASGGIGAAIAKALAAGGATVIVHYRGNPQKADQVVAEIAATGGKAWPASADIADPEAIAGLFAAIGQRHDRLDIVVNGAGVFAAHPLSAVTAEHFNHLFGINVLGLLLVTQAALPLFGDDGGSIINIGSLSGSMASPGQSIYAGTKGAVDAITRSLSKELGPRRIRVNAVNPGAVETPGLDGSGFMSASMRERILASTPLGRIGQPDDVASIVTFLASDAARWVNGQIILAAGGLTY